MAASARRLLDVHDPGLTTQRYQEDALRNLEELIQQAQQQNPPQQQPSPNSGEPNSQQQPPQQNTGQPQQPGAAPSEGQDARPSREETELNGELAEGRVEWGGLPARVRDMLLQGRSDSAASLYRRLTELYYQRLAEEANQ